MPRSHSRRRKLDKKRATKSRAGRPPAKKRRGDVDPMLRPPGQRPGDQPR